MSVLALLPAAPAAARVLRVGSYHGLRGQYATIQAAVNAARPHDWILVGPGDYHEQGVRHSREPAGVLIRTPRIHLRGMDRNRVIVDGTKRGAPACSSRARDQQVTRHGRNGIVVLKTSGVYIENLTVCNYLTPRRSTEEGNEIWWNGGDGSGKIGMGSWWGSYLTATSSYSRGTEPPFANYGIFASNARGPGRLSDSYGSNAGDGAIYVGACRDCNAVLDHVRGQHSALGYSGTNSGGRLIIEHSEFDHNKTGVTTNSQNNDDVPSPQDGSCLHGARGPLGDGICNIWRFNRFHDNNNPNVPGNGLDSLAAEAPLGTGFVLAGTRNVELYRNRIYRNDAYGLAVVDLPDQERPPPIAHCEGGTYLIPPPAKDPLCYFQAFGNRVVQNAFAANGGYRNPTNGDVALYAQTNDPGNCFQGNTDAKGLTSEPAGVQAPPFDSCGTQNGSTTTAALNALTCALRLAPCPAGVHYPRPARHFRLHRPPRQRTMPDPCDGVPRNPWCPGRR